LFDRLAGGFGGWLAGDQNTGCYGHKADSAHAAETEFHVIRSL
jgi:hypothetical protein